MAMPWVLDAETDGQLNSRLIQLAEAIAPEDKQLALDVLVHAKTESAKMIGQTVIAVACEDDALLQRTFADIIRMDPRQKTRTLGSFAKRSAGFRPQLAELAAREIDTTSASFPRALAEVGIRTHQTDLIVEALLTSKRRHLNYYERQYAERTITERVEKTAPDLMTAVNARLDELLTPGRKARPLAHA
jgi:hypothetical protein